MDCFWQNYSLRGRLQKAETMVNMLRSITGLDPLAIGKLISESVGGSSNRNIATLSPISVGNMTQSVMNGYYDLAYAISLP